MAIGGVRNNTSTNPNEANFDTRKRKTEKRKILMGTQDEQITQLISAHASLNNTLYHWAWYIFNIL